MTKRHVSHISDDSTSEESQEARTAVPPAAVSKHLRVVSKPRAAGRPAFRSRQRTLKLICSGKYEEESRALSARLQQALEGLNQPPQSDLAALQALVEGAEWTKNLHLAGVAEELVRSLAQHDLPHAAVRSSAVVDADLTAADERLKACPMRGEELEAYSGLLLEVNGLVTELQAAREAERRAQAFASEQALRLEEVRQLLGREVQQRQNNLEFAVRMRAVMSDGELFL